jgi:flagellar motor switch protein FliG
VSLYDRDRMAGAERAAVLLLAMGQDAATEVMRHLDENEVRKVSLALARVRKVQPEQIDIVNKEFKQTLSEGFNLSIDGKEYALTVVNKALSDEEALAAARRAEILAELEQTVAGDLGLASVLHGVPGNGLAALLSDEHPQIAAIILAHVPPAVAADAIGQLPEEMQGDVVERLARLETVPARLAAEVGQILKEQVKGLLRPAGSALGGPKAVAELMNHADKTVEARIFEEIEKNDPELVSRIRNLMFTFEDCMKLDNRSLQALLKEVPREDLLLALKTANPMLTEKIFSNVSSRAAEILKEDMASSGPVRLKDVEAAQSRIIATLRELEAEGKVVVAGGSKDDVLV